MNTHLVVCRLRTLLACVLSLPFALHAQPQPRDPDREIRPNVDRRQTPMAGPSRPGPGGGAPNVAAARNSSAAALRGKVPNVRIEFDELLGTPAFVASVNGHLSGPRGAGLGISNQALNRHSPADPHRPVKAFVDDHAALFGHDSSVLEAARLTRDYVTPHNGMRTAVWEQQLDGIRVFEATFQAHISRDGELINVGSRMVPALEPAAQRGAPARGARLVAPAVSARAAVALASRDLGEEIQEEDVSIASASDGMAARQKFQAPSLLDAEAQYVWLPLTSDTMRLCWEVICTTRAQSHMYRLLVDAESGEVLVRRSLTEEIGNATYRVFTSDSPSPFSPGHSAPSSAQPPLVPRNLVTLPALNTTASPNGWINDGVTETRGNNVDAHTDTNADNQPDLPRPQAIGFDRIFDPPLDLSQPPSTYRDAAVVDLFYWCNWMHDRLYELGFTESAGNFQIDNFGRGGLGNDPLQADAQDGSGTNNANFSTPPDGSSPRMQMFLWTGPTPARDGDFDHEVVLHEYTHGLSNRLVGGGVGISALQPRGMGEGWSDFFGIALLAEAGDNLNGNWARGGYSRYLMSGTFTENYYFGGRRYPYSTNLSVNPLTLKDIDPTQASSHAGIPRNPLVGTQADQVHNMGEVWCVTLWEARANLIAKHGFAVGGQLILQLVTDGMKLSPANPTYVQARDAILQADLVNTGGANRRELWAAFAKRGLGVGASVPVSSTATGVVESFLQPDDLSVTPFGDVSVIGDVGGPFAAQTYTLTNTGSSGLAWSAATTQPWASLSPASGVLAGGASVNVVLTFNASASALPQGNYSDTLTFTNTTTGVAQARTLTLTVLSAPTIASFSPATIAASMPVIITGTGFLAPVTVRFNGVPATSVTINSPTQLTAVAPSTLTGGSITVQNAAGTGTSLTPYTATLAPIITGFTPESGPGKRMVVLNGYNFSGTGIGSRTVRVNGLGVSSLTVSATRLTFPVPVGATTGKITVSTTNTSGVSLGTATSANDFVVQAGPAPANNAFASAQLISGNSGTLDVNTTNATREPGEPYHAGNGGGASIWFRWVAPATGPYLFQVQDTGLNMGTVLGIYTGGAVDALAVVAGGSSNSPFSRYSSGAMFNAVAGTTYRIAVDGYDGLMGECRLAWSTLSPPTISSVTGSAYPGQSITVSGTNLVPGATVTVGGLPISAVTYNSSTSLSIGPLPWNAVSGPVAVTTLAGTATSAGNVTITTAPAPTLTTTSVSAQIGGSVTLSGTALSLLEPGFPIVRFNGVAASTITSQSATSLTVRVPTGATTGPLTVQTSRGTSNAAAFTLNSGTPPYLFGFSPAAGAIGSAVTLQGANFSGVTAVQFNGVAASFVIDSANQVTATVPVGATTGTIRVVAGASSATSGSMFLVTTPPSLIDFNPKVIAAGTAVTISGTSFSAVSGVYFNGVAGPFVVDSPTQITATVPAGTLTPGPVTVVTQGGTATSSASFSLAAGAGIAGFTPTAIASGVTVVISGSGFVNVSAVRFNGVSASYTVNSPTQITATAPSTLSAGPITVVTSAGTATSPTNFSVTLAPIITSFTPATATNNQLITVMGGNYSGTQFGTPTVRVNGISVTSSSRTNNRITFPIPLGATTGPITITTLQGTATSATNITIAPGPAPGNDAFANARIITGVSGSTTGNIVNATKEPGEPNHSGNAGGASVWFKWTAPASGWFVFNPYDSSSSHYGIIQAIYTGDAVDELTPVASGLAGTTVFTRYTSAAALNAQVGTTYMIALDGYGGVMGDYRLSWSPLNAPTIASFSPGSAAADQTINIGISGSGFVPGTSVTIGGAAVAANKLTYASSTSITVAQVPAGAVTGPIVVTTPAGSATSATNFVITSPYILGFSPSGAAAGNTVTITGANFAGATEVRFNGFPAAGFIVDGAGQTITTTVPAGATTGPISVVTPTGVAVSSTPFVVIVPPVITLQPQSQTAFVGDTVTFTIAATSNGPEEYFWRKNGVGLITNASAFTRTLVLPSVTLADAGVYDCQVGNNAAIVTSNPATLSVNKLPATVALGTLNFVYDGSPKPVSATTNPAGLAVTLSYAGSPVPPTNAGDYLVVATIDDPRYAGSTTATLRIAKAPATVALGKLFQNYDGTPRNVAVTTVPQGLAVSVLYDGTAAAPWLPGAYAVSASVTDPNFAGSGNDTLVVVTTALVRHLPDVRGGIDGSVQLATADDVTLAGNAWLSGDLLVPGTPTLRATGGAMYVGKKQGPGAAEPSSHEITLTGHAALRYVVERVNPPGWPAAGAVVPPGGTRDVQLADAADSAGDWAAARNVSVRGNAGLVAVPPGTYGTLTASGNSGFILGVAGATEPAVYNVQSLILRSNQPLTVVGPVILNVENAVTLQRSAGSAAHPEWLTLSIHTGGVTISAGAAVHGTIVAPNGTVTLSGNATVHGRIIADTLELDANSQLEEVGP